MKPPSDSVKDRSPLRPSHAYPVWFSRNRELFESSFQQVVGTFAAQSGLGRLVPDAVNPGRRIRPTLYLSLLETVVGSPKPADLSVAAALEIFHSASIVVDDLADREERRRNKLPFFRLHGDESAILLSHFLLASGGLILAHHPDADPLLQSWLSCYRAAAEGQGFDQSKTLGLTVGEQQRLASAKTSAFFVFIADAIAVQRPSLRIDLQTSMLRVGEAFQASNDIVDLLCIEQSDRHRPGISYVLRPSFLTPWLVQAGIVAASEVFTALPYERHVQIASNAKQALGDISTFMTSVLRQKKSAVTKTRLPPKTLEILLEFMTHLETPSFWLHSHDQ